MIESGKNLGEVLKLRRIRLMKDKKMKKKVYAASVTLAVTATAALGVASYKSGISFNPSSEKRDFKTNQVYFPGENDFAENNPVQNNEESALWDKNHDMGPDGMPQNDVNPNYLFDNNRPDIDNGNDSSMIINNTDNDNAPDNVNDIDGTYNGDNIYDIVDDTDRADTIITVNPGNDSSGDNSNNNDNGNGGNSGDNTGDNGEDETDYSDSAKDPEVPKTKPALSTIYPSEAYDEDTISNIIKDITKNTPQDELEDTINKKVQVIIQVPLFDNDNALYSGQQIDENTIFCALETYVYDADASKLYLWGLNEYGQYIRIAGVSFDNGTSWVTEFPTTIPSDMDNEMIIRVEYRRSLKDEWSSTDVDYALKSNRVIILSDRLTEENEVINKDKILNTDKQYGDIDDYINLYSYQSKILQSGEVHSLFTGWKENGKLVPWIYKISAGRHILQPEESVALDDKYVVKMRNEWITNEGKIETDGDSISYYCMLQTLTDVNTQVVNAFTYNRGYRWVENLVVPKYIQSVNMEGKIATDTIEIPDTVIYINRDDNLMVNKAYIVDENNPNYVTENGVLYDKDKTKIIAIPYFTKELVVDGSIKKIGIAEINQISKIEFNADSMEDLPDIEYARIHDCKIIINDDLLEEFLATYGEKLFEQNNTVVAKSDNKLSYTVENGTIVDSEGRLHKVLGNTGATVFLPDSVKYIKAGSFDEASSITTMVMPESSIVEFEEGCLSNSSILTILCNTEAQVESVRSQLAKAGKTDINVILLMKSQEGYGYYTDNQNGVEKTVLATVPEDIESFDGTVTVDNENIRINIIAANAFNGCENLKWVILPESVTRIGFQAFKNCESLQGILIENKDTITILDKAFDGCPNLRFVASNALNANMADNYDPVIEDNNSNPYYNKPNMFFVLNDAKGYGENSNNLSTVYGVSGFKLVDAGTEGKVLYAYDENGDCWLALRAAGLMPDNVKLPETTTQIYNYAFADMKGVNGSFTFDFSDIPIQFIHVGAFYDSQLSGNVVIGNDEDSDFVMIRDYAFSGCDNIKEITIKSEIYLLGKEVFNKCEALEKVEIYNINTVTSTLYSGLFNGCDNLKELKIDNNVVPEVSVYDGVGYQFNYDWEAQEEQEKLKITVPEDMIDSYITEWRYAFTGYVGAYYGAPYLDLWYFTQMNMIDFDNMVFPTDSEVDEAVFNEVLSAENRVRTMFGRDTVAEPSNLYIYHENAGLLTLASTPSYETEIDLSKDGEELGLPSGWYFDYIGSDAFSKAASLKKLTIADNLVGIYSNALRNAAVNSDKLTITFKGETPVQLICSGEGIPFEFGVDDSKLYIEVPDNCKDAYIEAWIYPLSGYEDYESMYMSVAAEMMAEDENVDFEAINNEINNRLANARTRLNQIIK